jgi:predicted transcriptional regulator
MRVLPMATVTVKLDKQRAGRLARWAKQARVSKSDVIRALIDRAGPVETGEDLAEWVAQAAGKGLGLAQKDA